MEMDERLVDEIRICDARAGPRYDEQKPSVQTNVVHKTREEAYRLHKRGCRRLKVRTETMLYEANSVTEGTREVGCGWMRVGDG